MLYASHFEKHSTSPLLQAMLSHWSPVHDQELSRHNGRQKTGEITVRVTWTLAGMSANGLTLSAPHKNCSGHIMQINLCPDTPAQGILMCMYVSGCAFGCICLFVSVCLSTRNSRWGGIWKACLIRWCSQIHLRLGIRIKRTEAEDRRQLNPV